MSIKGPKLKLPRPRRITLRNFSLYSMDSTIQEEVPDGVFCLAGANGIGKSTFLTVINYGLTGIVPTPGRQFISEDEYYKQNLGFSADFFEGRINENDRDIAEIFVEFVVGETVFQVTRGFFEREELRGLSIRSVNESDAPAVLPTSATATPSDLHIEYTRRLAEATGLGSFEQFVFLQTFVLTFDERRHLLFWDQRVLEQSLYLAFGVQPTMAKKAVVLRRQIDRAESYARNYAWQAGQIRNQYNNIAKALGSVGQKDAGPEYLLGQFRALAEQKDETERKIEESKHSLKDAELRLSELSVTASILRNQYSRLFSDHISARTNVASHPIVTSSISEGRCNLCGASGPEVVNTIRSRAAGNKCPLCDSQLIQNMADGIDELMEVDSRILQTRTQIDETLRAIERVKDELRGREDSLKKTLSKLDDFEAKNQDLLQISKKMDLSDAQATLLRYRKQMEELQLKRDEEYGKRDEAKLELHKVRSELGRRYAEAEEEFVPLFRNLSNLFLGIDLDVRMESGSQGLNLVLDVKSTPRRQHHQLSESQRFFVDIALRMALSQYISDEQSKACLVIDTPEGSLDIAYESRAGGMLAEYALSGYQVIMTANINTSQLLIRLAAKCGHGGMKLVRMTPWVELSDVQIAEEGLFEEAFEKIEAALG